jgi:hypothetical protein
MSLITAAYFREGDFGIKVEILEEAYHNLIACLTPDSPDLLVTPEALCGNHICSKF